MTHRPVVLLDCDPGIDDALALCDLLARRAAAQIDLAGVVITAGNVDRDTEVTNALGWLELGRRTDEAAGRTGLPTVPVHPGAAEPLAGPHRFTPDTHGPAGAGYALLPRSGQETSPRTGAEAWRVASTEHNGALHGIVTGPLTTLAEAVRDDPGLPQRLASLTVMGGTFCGHPGNTTAVAEWNCHVDPEAAQLVATAWGAAGQRIRWCGQNVTDGARIYPAQITRLLTATGGAGITRALAAALRFYCEFHAAVNEGYHAKVHDAAVVALALQPRRGRWVPAVVDIACADPLTRGMTVAEMRSERWQRPANALVLVEVPGAGGAGGVIEQWAERHAQWVCGAGARYSSEASASEAS